MFANTICEDIWVPELAAEAAEMGAQVVFNISASPFHAGKGAEREAMLCGRARATTACGSRTATWSAGRTSSSSTAAASSSRRAARSSRAARRSRRTSWSPTSRPRARLGASGDLAAEVAGAEEVYAALVLGLRDYVRKNGFTDVVLGLSGGIDSALTAAIAADALGPEHVHGVMMPCRYSSPGSVQRRGRARGARWASSCSSCPIEPAVLRRCSTRSRRRSRTRAADVTEENLQARVRGTLLMALSNKFGWLVLATGNKSELSVGYSTLYGDMVGGFAPLKDVFKTRVYELARWRNAQARPPVIPQAIIDKAPSAELRPDQTDQDSLPPYDVLDAVLAGYVEQDASRDEIVADGIRPRSRRPRHPPDRHRRVQAPARAARRQDHAQGVRPGPPHAGHQPVSGAEASVSGFSIELVRLTTGAASTRCSTCPTTSCTARSACRARATGTTPPTAATFAVALDADGGFSAPRGCFRLPGDRARQVRQVAVSPDAHGRGVGRALMAELERLALPRRARRDVAPRARHRVWLLRAARLRARGRVFVSALTGIPHRTMRKRLP